MLGGLLVVGPLLAVKGLHPLAALVLAVGLGVRCRRLLPRLTPRHLRAAGLIAVVVAPGFGLWQWRSVQADPQLVASPPRSRPNLLWIVLDTVSADRMSVHGYHRPTTPEIERWARLGITFEQARSAAPWTLPSHLTMFTGLWPFEHGARVDRPYLDARPTLAEHLQGEGYATAGFVANGEMCNACYGLGRGFATYRDLPINQEISLNVTLLNSALGRQALRVLGKIGLKVRDEFPSEHRRHAPEILAEADEWYQQHHVGPTLNGLADQRPYMMFLNFMEAHGPYLPPASFSRQFWTEPLPPRRLATPAPGNQAVQAWAQAIEADKAQRAGDLEVVANRLGDLYDDCLRALDAQLGQALDRWRAEGRLDNTWIVITSDHGEHFGEHNLFGHGGSLYRELTHVPLILIPPLGDERAETQALRGRRIETPVSLRDLPATFESILTPDSPARFPGRALARHWESSASPVEPDPILLQLEQQPLEGDDLPPGLIVTMNAVIDEQHILIESSGRGPELYSLHHDPAEQTNLADSVTEQARLKRLRATLSNLTKGMTKP